MLSDRERIPWYDVMQVCENGHKITGKCKECPEDMVEKCPMCGASTLTKCPSCGTDIQGYKHIPSTGYIDYSQPPTRCKKCGKPFPWIKNQAMEPVEEPYRIISIDSALLEQIRKHTDGGGLVEDIDEIKKCMLHKLYRPAISSIAVAMENAFIIRLLKEDKDIRQEERNGRNWFLPELNKATYQEYGLISDKTFDRINILNKLRRFGTHSKSGSTIKQDADFAFGAFEQALEELFGNIKMAETP